MDTFYQGFPMLSQKTVPIYGGQRREEFGGPIGRGNMMDSNYFSTPDTNVGWILRNGGYADVVQKIDIQMRHMDVEQAFANYRSLDYQSYSGPSFIHDHPMMHPWKPENITRKKGPKEKWSNQERYYVNNAKKITSFTGAGLPSQNPTNSNQHEDLNPSTFDDNDIEDMEVIEWEVRQLLEELHQIPYVDYKCHICGSPQHLIKYCPEKDVINGNTKTAYQGTRESMAKFHCKKCARKWVSRKAKANETQQCRGCNQIVLPCKMFPLPRPQTELDASDVIKAMNDGILSQYWM